MNTPTPPPLATPRVTVYAKESGCHACDMTKKWLLERGIEFSVENIYSPEATAIAKRHHILSAPMVTFGDPVSPDVIFSDFREDVLTSTFPDASFPREHNFSLTEVRKMAPVPSLDALPASTLEKEAA